MSQEEILKHTQVCLKNNKLEAHFECPVDAKTRCSEAYILIGTVSVQIRSRVYTKSSSHTDSSYQVVDKVNIEVETLSNLNFNKLVLNVSSKSMNIEKVLSIENNGKSVKEFLKEFNNFTLCGGGRGYPRLGFDLTIWVDIEDTVGMFCSLYDDTDLVDFKLCGEGGAVSVHKAALAAASLVFKRMLSVDWKETDTGKLTIPGISKAALEKFKAYLYLQELPDSDLDWLLLIASCYMMPAFELKCIEKILSLLTAENILHWCKFAAKNQMTRLLIAILEHIQHGAIRVGDIYSTTIVDGKENASDL